MNICECDGKNRNTLLVYPCSRMIAMMSINKVSCLFKGKTGYLIKGCEDFSIIAFFSVTSLAIPNSLQFGITLNFLTNLSKKSDLHK